MTHRPVPLIAVCLAGMLASVSAGNLFGQSWAEKMFSTMSHDFRSVGRGTKAEFRFEFKNLYEEDVHVAAVRTSCGCTTASVTADVLQTYETGAVVAKLNTASFIGHKSAVITVVFDRPFYAEVRLQVSGHIRTDITFDPPEVAFGEHLPGSEAEREITITRRGNPDWRITDVRSHCPHLRVQLGSAEQVSAVGGGTPLVRYRMVVRLRDSMPEGDITEQLTLVSNDKSFPMTEMSVSGKIRPTLTIAPAALSLGRVRPDSVTEQRLVIRGETPFRIVDVVCDDDRIELDIPEESKRLHFLQLRFRADDPSPVAARVKVQTDLADRRSVSLVVTGAVE